MRGLDSLRWELWKILDMEIIFSIAKERNFQTGAPSTTPTHRYGKPPGFPVYIDLLSMYAGSGLPAMGTLKIFNFLYRQRARFSNRSSWYPPYPSLWVTLGNWSMELVDKQPCQVWTSYDGNLESYRGVTDTTPHTTPHGYIPTWIHSSIRLTPMLQKLRFCHALSL